MRSRLADHPDRYFFRINPSLPPDRSGWMGTGDAKLNDDTVRKDWLDFYATLRPTIGTLLLPHHGSNRNWHQELLQRIEAELCVAAADELDEGYKHPGFTVRMSILNTHRELIHVTKRPETYLIEEIEG